MKASFATKGVAAVVVALALATPVAAEKAKKVIVLGVDGLDPNLLKQFVSEGVLPNFEKLMQQGDFRPLQTSMPPLSPVAWSNFITGQDPGGHGIFDFIHRDPSPIIPYQSMSRAHEAERSLEFGSWVFPLSSGSIENLRRGKAFWELLEESGVPTMVFRMPANFPPVETGGRALSGMGTPDIRGGYGTFSFFTDRPVPNAANISGGDIYPVAVVDNVVEAELVGPPNTFRRVPRKTRRRSANAEVQYTTPDAKTPFTVYLDPEQPVAKFEVGDNEFVLREGEWSDWVRIDFELVPALASVSATGRFYLRQVRPDFELYVTPLQINPEDPALPISVPEEWSHELFEALGYFYTQQLPEDTKALQEGIFTGREFWHQAQLVYQERRRALDHFLGKFDEGLLFFYFSSIDQNSHMLWRYADPDHPDFQQDEMLVHGIRTVYTELDEALGRTMAAIDDDTTLIVMSDHGFCPFYWGVNLNTWLLEKGYVTLRDPSKQGRYKFFGNVDWSRTKAYALGLNGLYVNLRGREANGIVNPGREHQELLDQLERDLLGMVDPRNGNQVVTLVVQTKRDFHGPYLDVGPDIIVGYNWGYRCSWETPLGEFPEEVFVDNDNPWSGDHSVDYRHVPGVLLTNKKITMDAPGLRDLTVGILDEYGVAKTQEMLGQDCLGEPVEARVSAGATDVRAAP